ncbi:MAG: class I SAM-dependent DNA methyltransferase [Candidatus Riflebacteria bacterium HGW-Riflebacteria-2]|jgi:type II restriction/modification system DNA methylase subunit YeeA|nr:MAG: class I SAM-dependent DNA methyltransferase [Candidatus Riflebacteria bacterium HGW-Riflebacteria-2]
MDTSKIKKFAQYARRNLIEQVEAKLKLVLAGGSAARRENTAAIKKLEESIAASSKEQVVERVAYIWFNRFCALRYMDINRYTGIGVVSPAAGQFQPEILAEAKMGHIADEIASDKVKQQVFAVLDDKTPSRDPQGEAYRLLIVAVCNFWNKQMPFLFQRIDDFTELLMPDDLLSGNSILAYTREAMTPEVCQDVEVIGWLYQFYISEKKDRVFEGLKKNKKITPENIPAATQLFTPHWIVRYLVENSLGRLWMLNRPNSKLIKKMDYYIKPDQPETDFLRVSKPEEIKICDPACGSGHMLVYAFDLLYAIYEEEGYEAVEIPEKILTNNLYGIEIDERAGELAAFALAMKALQYDKRFFRRMNGDDKTVKPNVCVLQNVIFDDKELKDYMDFVGRDLFAAPLQTTLRQFEEADNFGSLIRPDVTDVDGMLRILETKNVSEHLFISITHHKVLQAMRQADYLSPKYHVVIANPPYMGSRSMNKRLDAFAKGNYPLSKADIYAIFIERGWSLSKKLGYLGFISMQSWMFLSSFEKLRSWMLSSSTITNMAHLGERAFDSIGGAVVSTTAFITQVRRATEVFGTYVRLTGGKNESEKSEMLRNAALGIAPDITYRTTDVNFKKIPGSPIAYWVSQPVLDAFTSCDRVSDKVTTAYGLITMDNNRFVREWQEVNLRDVFLKQGDSDDWVPYNNGGTFRKWFGNHENVVRWKNDGQEVKQFAKDKNGSITRTVVGQGHYFKEGISWNAISTDKIGVRHFPSGFIFSNASMCAFGKERDLDITCSVLNAKVAPHFLRILAPSVNFGAMQIGAVPFPKTGQTNAVSETARRLSAAGKFDWNSYETSWDFTGLPLLNPEYRQATLKNTYQKLRAHWREMTLEMQHLEEENNRIFIEAYGLQDELTPEVPLGEITLTCNPWYRYGKELPEQKKGEFPIDQELEDRLLADTMKEFISYAVGCMFGRYALEKPGLILANQGETFEDYLKQIPEPSFPADKDNVIPMLDGDWFTDDITERFRQFLRVTFSAEHYEENLKFIEDAIGKDIRKDFLKDFYSDHVKRYKKRPIYWLFSSPKGSFNALIYMHRYRPDTVSVVLNDYLREFRTKLAARLDHLKRVEASGDASKAEKAKALKEIENLKKTIDELNTWEHDVLYPLATSKIEIDLDDGVKANYPKFGTALKKIPGLDAKDEE